MEVNKPSDNVIMLHCKVRNGKCISSMCSHLIYVEFVHLWRCGFDEKINLVHWRQQSLLLLNVFCASGSFHIVHAHFDIRIPCVWFQRSIGNNNQSISWVELKCINHKTVCGAKCILCVFLPMKCIWFFNNTYKNKTKQLINEFNFKTKPIDFVSRNGSSQLYPTVKNSS